MDMSKQGLRDSAMLTIAEVYADMSTCARMHVGAIIVRQGRTMGTGYNGAPAGLPHCAHDCDCAPAGMYHAGDCASLVPCRTSVHAEANAIAFSAHHGVATAGATMYTTLSPCVPCAQLIINAGLVRVVYRDEYRDPAGIDLLRAARVEVVQGE